MKISFRTFVCGFWKNFSGIWVKKENEIWNPKRIWGKKLRNITSGLLQQRLFRNDTRERSLLKIVYGFGPGWNNYRCNKIGNNRSGGTTSITACIAIACWNYPHTARWLQPKAWWFVMWSFPNSARLRSTLTQKGGIWFITRIAEDVRKKTASPVWCS